MEFTSTQSVLPSLFDLFFVPICVLSIMHPTKYNSNKFYFEPKKSYIYITWLKFYIIHNIYMGLYPTSSTSWVGTITTTRGTTPRVYSPNTTIAHS